MTQRSLEKVAEKENTDVSKSEAFEVADPNHKFMVIEGPQPVIVQFFRHYGHPVRDENSLWIGDRVREVVCIMIICCLFLYFPAGLLMAQWSNEDAQYLWLAYQLYAVIAMHAVRVLGWQDVGRTEKRIARYLSNGKTVWLRTRNGCAVSASLVLHAVSKTADGKDKVQEIIEKCKELLEEGGNSTSSSQEHQHRKSPFPIPTASVALFWYLRRGYISDRPIGISQRPTKPLI
jgi:hypothetical protein